MSTNQSAHDHKHDHAPGHKHDHAPGHTHDHAPGHTHDHKKGLKGWLYELFVPHTHDANDSIDDALESSSRGIKALKISVLILIATTIAQAIVVWLSGSVALLADTIHNLSDALTALPLWVAFVLGRRVADRRHTYGFGRAEDLAGLFIVLVVAASAVVAAWQAIDRFINPQPLTHLWWVMAAGVIGFIGNEIVAAYRIKVGHQIGSAALVADGVHARLDGFTSLAVVLGAGGAMLGFPLFDPIIGLAISVAIIFLLWGTVKNVGGRLMERIEPELVTTAETALAQTDGIVAVPRVQLRWVGHRLQGTALVEVHAADFTRVEAITRTAEHKVRHALPKLDDFLIKPVSQPSSITAHAGFGCARDTQ